METHGRADAAVAAELPADARQIDTGTPSGCSRHLPVRLSGADATEVAAELDAVPPVPASTTRLLRYLRAEPPTACAHRDPQILLNYLGGAADTGRSALRMDRALLAEVSRNSEPMWAVRHEITLNVLMVEKDGEPVLGTQWRTVPDILSADDVAALQALWRDALREVVS